MQQQLFQDIDPVMLALFGLGAVLAIVSTIWFLVVGFRQHVLWGVAMLLGCGFAHFAFLIVHFKKAWAPTLLAIVATVLMMVPAVLVAMKLNELQVTGVEQRVQVPGDPADPSAGVTEQRITLTGAKREEYAKLGKSKKWAVIQWANKDVTDDDVEALHGMTELRELDLSDSQVTDEGLHAIEGSDKLGILRLARTAVTEAGFKEHVEPMAALMELDLRGTKVPAKVGREWKAKVPGRKLLQ